MAKLYTKNTWVDEVLAGAERFDIKEDGGAAIHSNTQIVLATGVTTAGTPVDASKMNNIENGVDAIDTRVNNLSPDSQTLQAGTVDSADGTLNLFGAGTGVADGGQINLYTAADYDTTVDKWVVDAYGEDLRVLRNPGAVTVAKFTSLSDFFTDGWTDYSSTSTITGWAAGMAVQRIYYKKIGKLVFVQFNLSGTSNSTEAKFTLPYTHNSDIFIILPIRVRDNGGAYTTGLFQVATGGSEVSCFKDLTSAAFTATGAKRVDGSFFYQTS